MLLEVIGCRAWNISFLGETRHYAPDENSFDGRILTYSLERSDPRVLFLSIHIFMIILWFYVFVFFTFSSLSPAFIFSLPRGSHLLVRRPFLVPTAAHGSHPTTIHEYPCTSTSIFQRLFNKLLQSNSQIHTITKFTTQYSPFLFTVIHTIRHLSAFFPSTQNPPKKTPKALGSKCPYKKIMDAILD